jgi:hypothetical protein
MDEGVQIGGSDEQFSNADSPKIEIVQQFGWNHALPTCVHSKPKTKQ